MEKGYRGSGGEKGLTLIGLVISIFIIGLLSTIAISSVNSARIRARDTQRANDVEQFRKALEMYHIDRGVYPIAAGGIVLGDTGATTLCDTSGFGDTCVGTPYLTKIPLATTPLDGDCTAEQNTYTYTSTGTDYTITFCLSKKIGAIAAGARIMTPEGPVDAP